MARMIPNACDPTAPKGERRLYRLLKENMPSNWTVLHSQDIAKHTKQQCGEADFVVLVPDLGVLVMEVKDYRIIRRNRRGTWYVGSEKVSSPIRQAQGNFHSIKDRIHCDPTLKGVWISWAVCFPYMNEFPVRDAFEWDEWQIITKPQVQGDNIKTAIRRAIIRSANKRPGRQLALTPNQKEKITQALRPAFDSYESPARRKQIREDELKHFTEDQFRVLDMFDVNDHVLISGPAGSGKTLMALDISRRAAQSDQRVLFCCYNRLIGQWLTSELLPLEMPEDRLTAGTLHNYMLRVTGLEPPRYSIEDQPVYDTTLPNRTIEVLRSGSSPLPKFDVLVVDEAQDTLAQELRHKNYLDVLDASLRGGLADGRWIMFGDFERQALYDSRSGAQLLSIFESRRLRPARYPLKDNCRNPREIASLMSSHGGQDEEMRILRPENGIRPQFRYYRTEEQRRRELDKILDGLKSHRYTHEDVVVLYRSERHPVRDDLAGAHGRSNVADPLEVDRERMRRAADDSTDGSPNASRTQPILATTIRKFKGRESPVVVLVDDMEQPLDTSLLYTGISRATERLIILSLRGNVGWGVVEGP